MGTGFEVAKQQGMFSICLVARDNFISLFLVDECSYYGVDIICSINHAIIIIIMPWFNSNMHSHHFPCVEVDCIFKNMQSSCTLYNLSI